MLQIMLKSARFCLPGRRQGSRDSQPRGPGSGCQHMVAVVQPLSCSSNTDIAMSRTPFIMHVPACASRLPELHSHVQGGHPRLPARRPGALPPQGLDLWQHGRGARRGQALPHRAHRNPEERAFHIAHQVRASGCEYRRATCSNYWKWVHYARPSGNGWCIMYTNIQYPKWSAT